jgi:hypothetical protein
VATATASGTYPTGSTNSIGTKISSVGTADPFPTSKSSRNAAAYAKIRTMTAGTAGLRLEGRRAAVAAAATTNPPASTAMESNSRPARR